MVNLLLKVLLCCSVLLGNTHHKTRDNFNDSTFCFCFKTTQKGMYWTLSRFRFTVGVKETLTYSVSLWSHLEVAAAFPLDIFLSLLSPSLFCLSVLPPVSCFHVHIYNTGMSKCLRVPCLKSSSSLLPRLSERAETHRRSEDVCEIL